MTEKQLNELKAKLVDAFEPVARLASEFAEELVKRLTETEKEQKEKPKAPVEATKEIQTFCRSIDCINCPMNNDIEDECSLRSHFPFRW